VEITVSDVEPLQTLDALYLGFNLDSGSLYRNVDLGNGVLQQLTRNLAPAQLRVGGSASDSIWYVPDGAAGAGPSPDPLAPNFVAIKQAGWTYSGYIPNVTILSDASWAALCGFASTSGMELLFDLNAVDFRTAGGAWDAGANATALLAQTVAANLRVAAWELGNEPDLWSDHFGLSVPGQQLGQDLAALQQLTGKYGLSQRVFGPSFATWNESLTQAYLQGWVGAGGGELGFTVHAYPLGEPTYELNNSAGLMPQSPHNPSCTVANYLNLSRVSDVAAYLANFSAAVAAYGNASATRLVLEETASSSMGGCVGFSDRFISGFYWLNLLGTVGEAGFQQVNRQDLAGLSFTDGGSQYTLFGPPGWTNGSAGLVSADSPHPDYWTSLLWKKLMGTAVLNSTAALGGTATNGTFVAHVWCTAAGVDPPPGLEGASGSVTLAFANTAGYSLTVAGIGGAGGGVYPLSPRREYFLTSSSQGPREMQAALSNYSIYLNNVLLAANGDGSLPGEVKYPRGRLQMQDKPLELPPYSYGFVVLGQAGAPACTAAAAAAAAAAAPRPLLAAVPGAWAVPAAASALMVGVCCAAARRRGYIGGRKSGEGAFLSPPARLCSSDSAVRGGRSGGAAGQDGALRLRLGLGGLGARRARAGRVSERVVV